MMIRILLAIYLTSWFAMFMSFKGTPIGAIRKSIEVRGIYKTIVFFIIIPFQYLVFFLEKAAETLEDFINFCMK